MSTISEQQESGRHPVNIGHLVMGVAILALVAVWALWQGDVVADDDVRWLMPVPWVLAGVAGLAASAVTGTRRYTTRQTGWVETATETTAPTTEPTTEHVTAENAEEQP